MTESPLLVAPTGELVDGRRLLAEAVGFGRALRAAGLPVDLGAAMDFARALSLVDLGHRDQVHAAGAAVFVRRRDDREVYDRVFAQFWRRRGPQARARPPGRARRTPTPTARRRASRARPTRPPRAATPRWPRSRASACR